MKYIATIIGLCFTCSIIPQAHGQYSPPSVFSDMLRSHTNLDAINYIQRNGIVSGFPDGTYKPELSINRAEFAKILVNALYSEEEIDACVIRAYSFPDVPEDAWFAKYVCHARKAGIIDGYHDGTFKPGNSINFVEAAKMLSQSFAPPTTVTDYPWYESYVVALEEQNAIPIDVERFNHVLTRGQMAEIIYRLHAKIDSKSSLTYNYLSGTEQGIVEDFSKKKEPTSWEEKFVQSPDDIPVGAFRAYYFDTKNPEQGPLLSEIVQNVSINYAWSEGPGFTLKSEHFGGYWIGYMDVTEAGKWEVQADQSWSETRLVIDGEVIYEGGDKKVFTHYLPKGKHKVEVYFVNNWHTVGFSLSLQKTPFEEYNNPEDAQRRMQDILPDDYVVWFAGVYESGESDNHIDVSLAHSTKDVIVVLSSYSAIHWQLHVPKNVPVAAVIVSTFSTTSSVNGVEGSVPVFRIPMYRPHNLEVDCVPRVKQMPQDFCKSRFLRANEEVEVLTGDHGINSFAGEYAPTDLFL